jgi:outer membrane protein assembly factor BamD
MMNTYDTSEFLAKAKLAMADSWQREGGAHGLAQAEAEYKDFILFYPNMEEAAEAQYKICGMQYDQMDKPDRDPLHSRMAEAECKDVLDKWPNSKFASDAADKLRKIQEVEAEGEMKVSQFYAKRGGNGYFASANRANALVDQFPLYSHADEALWLAADDYLQIGDRFEDKQAEMYTRLVRDYPLSPHVEDAKAQLRALNRPVPDADPVAEARMKFEQQNRTTRGLMSKVWGPFSGRPDTTAAAKSGTPRMDTFRPTTPADVPVTAASIATTNEVTIGPVATRDILGTAPDARAGTPNAEKPAAPASGDTTPATAKPADSAAPAPTTATDLKKNKPPKPPKQVALKKRPKPAAAKKSTAAPPAPAPTPAQTPPPADTPAASPAKAPGGGGPGVPEARQ